MAKNPETAKVSTDPVAHGWPVLSTILFDGVFYFPGQIITGIGEGQAASLRKSGAIGDMVEAKDDV